MRHFILALCLVLACGSLVAGTEEIVSPDQEQKEEQATKADQPAKAAEGEATDDAACRQTFNTLEDIYAAVEALTAKEAAAKAEADATTEKKVVPAVEWKDVAPDQPER